MRDSCRNRAGKTHWRLGPHQLQLAFFVSYKHHLRSLPYTPKKEAKKRNFNHMTNACQAHLMLLSITKYRFIQTALGPNVQLYSSSLVHEITGPTLESGESGHDSYKT